MDTVAIAGAPERTPNDTLRPREELVSLRAGAWRLLVPLRHVERVLAAAMPSARPGAAPSAPVVALAGEVLPVVFASALLGAGEVRLAASDQMIVLADRGRRAVLWVDAVEDVVPHTPAPAPAGSGARDLVLAWSAPERPLAVLDVPRLLDLSASQRPVEGGAP